MKIMLGIHRSRCQDDIKSDINPYPTNVEKMVNS